MPNTQEDTEPGRRAGACVAGIAIAKRILAPVHLAAASAIEAVTELFNRIASSHFARGTTGESTRIAAGRTT